MAFRRTSYGLSEPSVSMRNSSVSLISGASCGSFAARVSIARRRSNGGSRNPLVTRAPFWKRGNRLTSLIPEATFFYQLLRRGAGCLPSNFAGVEGFSAGKAEAEEADGDDQEQAGFDEEFAAVGPIHRGILQGRISEEAVPKER